MTPREPATFATQNWSVEPEGVSRRIAPLTNRDQAYYWSSQWQRDEFETVQELSAGRGETFPDADAAIRWLLSADE